MSPVAETVAWSITAVTLPRSQLSDSAPATATLPAPAPASAKLHTWSPCPGVAGRFSSESSGGIRLSSTLTEGTSVIRISSALTSTRPPAVTSVLAPRMLALTADAMSLVAEAPARPTEPAPAAAPATLIMIGATEACTLTSPALALTTAPLPIDASTSFCMKLMPMEPARATAPAPAPPAVMLSMLASERASTSTSPLVAVTLEASIKAAIWPTL